MKISGIVPPLITPLSDYDTLDLAGLERLTEHVINGGVHGIFALGSTGEGPSHSYQLRRDFIERLCTLVDGRVPVVVGITDTSFVESVRLSQFAADAGADAVVLSTPYYFPAGQTELLGYVQRLVPELALPVLLYNMPSLTKVWFEIDTLRQLATDQRIIGIKDSSGDFEYFQRVLELRSLRPDWSILIGPEDRMIQATQLGGDGGVNGGANIFPRLYVAAWQAARDGDAERCKSLQSKIEAFGAIYDIGKYASRHIKATKCAAGLLGLCADSLAEPFNSFYDDDRAKVKSILDSVNYSD